MPMECTSETDKNSWTRDSTGQSKKRLGEMLGYHKPQPKTTPADQNMYTDSRSIENEELVKYMSTLPTFLQNQNEKAFSVGVLDYRRLQKWQQTHCGSTPSTTNTSPFSSAEETSSTSSRARSCSPAKGIFENEKNLNNGAFQSLSIEHRTRHSLDENTQNNLRQPVDPQHTSYIRRSLDVDIHARPSTSKGKTKIHGGVSLSKQEDDFVILHHGADVLDCRETHKTVHFVSDASRESSGCSTSCPQDLVVKGRCRQSYSGQMASGITHSCPHAPQADSLRHIKTQSANYIDTKGIKSSSSEMIRLSGTQQNNLQEKSTVILSNPTEPDPLNLSNLEKGTSETMKVRYPSPLESTAKLTNPLSRVPNHKFGTSETINVRNPSPTRRLSMAMSRISRIPIKKDTMGLAEGIVKQPTQKSLPETSQSSPRVDSGCGKFESTSRERSSPLRRLLDPLLKTKTGNSDHIIGSSEKGLPSVDKPLNTSSRRGESPTKRSLKVKLDLKSCKDVEIDDQCSNEKCRPAMLKALLQVKLRNGLPLFTFAVDNDSDILAATLKKFGSSVKEYNSCIYTFFTICETKKKSGSWLNQGGKERCHRIMPNIIGKMKVSEAPSGGSNKHIYDSPFRIREFVLFPIDSRHAGIQTSELQQNEELAAIVVKLSNRGKSNSYQRNHGGGNQNNTSVASLADHLNGVGHCKGNKNWTLAGFEETSITVVLPGGAHGQPSKGEPSSLIERWKSGGLCDCGGWDLGCKITLLVNRTNHQRKFVSAKASPPSERFELFTKGEDEDSKPIFRLSLFKDGIFSVEFNPSLKVLQAFSICIAVLNAGNQEKFPELADLIAEDTCEGTMFPEDLEGVQVELPSKFVSIPPLSPVGRV